MTQVFPPIGLPVATYSDGGVIRRNPSDIGGTWAYCQVDDQQRVIAWESGVLIPFSFGKAVTNNETEFYAALRALRSLPADWSGTIHSDSMVTLRRLGLWPGQTNTSKLNGLYEEWVSELGRHMKRLGQLRGVCVAGHPTRRELEAGVAKDGRPASEFLVFCDRHCTREANDYVARRGRYSPIASHG